MFKNIIGNEEIQKRLEKSVENRKVLHSYIFVGQEGIGKKKMAKEFAKMILCLGEPKYCDNCKSCIEFNSENHPDFFELEPEEKSIKIEQIRSMQTKIAEKPIISENKVYIINNADTMTKEAQNCLLKTLEEPPEYVTIILVGTNENLFLNTIKSRCVIMHFNPIKKEEIKKYLLQENEGEINETLLDMAQGSIGKAIQLKDQIEQYKEVESIIKNLDKMNILQIIKKAEILYKSKESIGDMLNYMNTVCINQTKENPKMILAIDIIEDTKQRLKMNSNYDMSIDNLIFNMWEAVNEKNSRNQI